MTWYRKNNVWLRTSSSNPSFNSHGSHDTPIIFHHNIDDEYQKCLQSNTDTTLSSVMVNGIRVNPGDNFTYNARFSRRQRILAEHDSEGGVCFKPKQISIYRNHVYDHDITPTQDADVIMYYRWGLLPEADNYCKKLDMAAGNIGDIHHYDIRRYGNFYTIKFHPCCGWGNEHEYKYTNIIECLKHIVVNSNTYNDTELGFELNYLDSYGCIINSVNIRNKAELKQYIQNNVQLPF